VVFFAGLRDPQGNQFFSDFCSSKVWWFTSIIILLLRRKEESFSQITSTSGSLEHYRTCARSEKI